MCERCQEFYVKRAREYKDLAAEIQKVVRVHMAEVVDTGSAELFVKTNATSILQEIQFALRAHAIEIVQKMDTTEEILKLGVEIAEDAMSAFMDTMDAAGKSLVGREAFQEKKKSGLGGRLKDFDLGMN